MKIFQNNVNLDKIGNSNEESFNEMKKVKDNIDRLEYFFHERFVDLSNKKDEESKKMGLFIENVLNEDISKMSLISRRFLAGFFKSDNKEDNDLLELLKLLYKNYEMRLKEMEVSDSFNGWIKEREKIENIDIDNLKF